MKKKIIIFILISLTAFFAKGQEENLHSVKNVKAELIGDKIRVTYDLIGIGKGVLYHVRLYASYDNFNRELEDVNGNIGKEIQQGNGQVIEWDYSEELGNYRNKLAFEVRADIMLTILKIKPIYKRQDYFLIEWLGGGANDHDMRIELYHQDKKVQGIGETTNMGQFRWTIPKKLKPRNGYKIKITNLDIPDQTYISDPFAVKRKVPLLYTLGPSSLAVLGTGIWYLFFRDLPAFEIPE